MAPRLGPARPTPAGANFGNEILAAGPAAREGRERGRCLALRRGRFFVPAHGVQHEYHGDCAHRRLVPNDDAADMAAARVASLQEALDAIGLRLRPQKVPVEVLAVDHAVRVPSEK